METKLIAPYKGLIAKMPKGFTAIRDGKAHVFNVFKNMSCAADASLPIIVFPMPSAEDGVYENETILKAIKLEMVSVPEYEAEWANADAVIKYASDVFEQPLLCSGSMETFKKAKTLSTLCGVDDLMPAFQHVYFGASELCATDATVLGVEPHDLWFEDDGFFMLKGNAINTIAFLAKDNDILSVYRSSEYTGIKFGEYHVLCKNTDVTYPNYRPVFPESENAFWKVNRKGLIDALSVVAKRKCECKVGICLESPDKMALIFNSVDDTKPCILKKTAVKVFEKGENCPDEDKRFVVFDAFLMAKILKTLSEDFVKIEISSETRPITLNGSHLLMPLNSNTNREKLLSGEPF